MKNPNYRYEIGYEGISQEDARALKIEAFEIAKKLKEKEPKLRVYVFDRMAHKGAKSFWLID